MTSKQIGRLGFLVTSWVAIVLAGSPPDASHRFQTPEKESPTVSEILDHLVFQFNRIEDYVVRVEISIDMPRFRMPAKTVQIYFKHPDKVKVEADGFAVVPKTGLAMSPAEIFRKLFQLRVAAHDEWEGRSYWVVEGIVRPDSMEFRAWSDRPKEETAIRTQLWVDAKRWVITRAETFADTTKVLSIQSSFGEFNDGIWLPVVTELQFQIAERFLTAVGDHEPPEALFGEEAEETTGKGEMGFKGLVRLEFSQYKVNQGLKDEIFDDTTF